MFIEEEVKGIQYGVDFVRNKSNLPPKGSDNSVKPFKLFQASDSEVVQMPKGTHINTESDDLGQSTEAMMNPFASAKSKFESEVLLKSKKLTTSAKQKDPIWEQKSGTTSTDQR